MQWSNDDSDVKYDIGHKKAIDFGFHDKDSGESLYNVIYKLDKKEEKSRFYMENGATIIHQNGIREKEKYSRGSNVTV